MNLLSRRSSRTRRRPKNRDAYFEGLVFEPLEPRLLMTTFTVTSNADAGAGTLRQAVLDANANTGQDVIFFDAILVNSTSGIVLTTGEIPVTDDMTINGPGSPTFSIGSAGASRVFNIDNGNDATLITVFLSALVISNAGVASGNGGAILSRENLFLTASTVSGCSVTSGSGGAVSSSLGTLTITSSTLSGNSATNGGAVFGSSTVRVNNSTFSSNTGSNRGGGLYLSGSGNLIQNSTLSGNASTTGGGGGVTSTVGLTIINSTLSGNTAGSYGGGISALSGTLNIRNSTISGNSAATHGGGVYNVATTAVHNSTLTGNRADSDDTDNGTGGAVNTSGGSLTLHSSLVVGNFQGSGSTDSELTGTDAAGASANNLVDAVSPHAGMANGNQGNIVGVVTVSNIISPLANNGGPTQTHALLPATAAVNAGSNLQLLTTDQRSTGFSRVGGSAADIGAFEIQSLVTIGNGGGQASESLTGETTFTFTISREGDTGSSLPVDLRLVSDGETGHATFNSDFTLPDGLLSVTIPAGQASANIIVTVVDDAAIEAPETVTMGIAAGTGYTADAATVDGTIFDGRALSLGGANPLAGSYANADGDTVNITLKGPGALTAFFSSDDTAASPPPAITLSNSTLKTSLSVLPAVAGNDADVQSFNIQGAINALTAKDLLGNLGITGDAKKITFGDAMFDNLISIGGAGMTFKSAVTIVLDQGSGADLTSIVPIKALTARRWDADGDDQVIVRAPRVDKLTIAEDYEGDLIVNEGGPPGTKPVVGTVTIGGLLGHETNSVNWNIDGGVKKITAGKIKNATVDILTSLGSLTVSPPAPTLNATFLNSFVTVHQLFKKFTLDRVDTTNDENSGNDFGLYADSFGSGKYKQPDGTLVSAVVPPNVDDFDFDIHRIV